MIEKETKRRYVISGFLLSKKAKVCHGKALFLLKNNLLTIFTLNIPTLRRRFEHITNTKSKCFVVAQLIEGSQKRSEPQRITLCFFFSTQISAQIYKRKMFFFPDFEKNFRSLV